MQQSYYDNLAKITEDILNTKFVGLTVDDDVNSPSQNTKDCSNHLVEKLVSSYEVNTNQVKLYQINGYDWIAALSLENAIQWYKEHILEDGDHVHQVTEEKDLDSFMVNFIAVEPTSNVYKDYEELQNKYYVDKNEATYQIPAIELIHKEWEGETYLFSSTYF